LGTTYGPPPVYDIPESFFPLSTKCDITSSFVGKSDTIETKAPKNLFPGVVEPEFTKSETLLPEVP